MFVTNQKQMYFLCLNFSDWHRNLFENPLIWGERLHGSSNLWLFVPVSHQSASVKASTAGVLTSTLRILPPPPSAWLFLFAPLCLYAQYTPYLLNSPLCTELEDAKLPLLECKCKVIHFFKKNALCLWCVCKSHILHSSVTISGQYIQVYINDQSQALVCFLWKSS